MEKVVSQEAVDQLEPLLNLKGSNAQKLDTLEQLLAVS